MLVCLENAIHAVLRSLACSPWYLTVLKLSWLNFHMGSTIGKGDMVGRALTNADKLHHKTVAKIV